MGALENQRSQGILDDATKQIEQMRFAPGGLDEYFLIALRDCLIDAGATATHLRVVAVLVVGLVAPPLVDE